MLIVDALKRETVEPWKLGITLFLSGLLFLALMKPDSFILFQYPNESWFLDTNDIQMILFTILLGWTGCVFFYHAILLIKKSPPSVKKFAWAFLFSLLLISLGPAIILILPVATEIPHLDTIINALGFLLFAYILSQHPELFYILPFKVLRLTVLDMDTGISLYDHTWKSNATIMDKAVYSGFLQGNGLL